MVQPGRGNKSKRALMTQHKKTTGTKLKKNFFEIREGTGTLGITKKAAKGNK